MIEINVSKEMWAEWKESPVSKAFFRSIFERREQLKEFIAVGGAKEDVGSYIAKCQELKAVLDTEFEDNPS